MKQFHWVIIIILLTVVSSMLPAAVVEAAQAGAEKWGLAELTNGSDSIVVGTVVERSSYWNDEHTRIFTSVVLSVEERLKGEQSQDQITITLPGGEAEGIWEWVSDMASFDQGERAVVFLKKLSDAQLPRAKASKGELSEEQFEVYGGFLGKITIKQSRVGNLTEAEFKERVKVIVRGQVLPAEELDVPSSPVSFPYSYAGFCWPHPPSPVVYFRTNENTTDCTGEGAAVQSAAATWNAAGANFSFSNAGTTTATFASKNNVNEILWRNLGYGTTIAQTTIWGYGTTITECDMEFNDYYSFSTAASCPAGYFDVQTIALHEFGHYFCLDDLYDPADSAKVMYGYGDTGSTKRTLHSDDTAGIQYIYGKALNAPSGLVATAISSTQVNLSWQDNSDNESGFKIERKTGSGGTYAQIATVGANVSSYSNTGITASTTYYYRVRAYNAAGNSPYCDEASATTLPPPPPAPVKKSPANASTGASLTPRLEWNASTGASDYALQVSTSSTFTSLLVDEAGITNLYYDIPGGLLNWNTLYYWRVNAHNSSGTSAWSVYWSFRTATGPPPNPPSNLVATAISSSRIDLSWQDNSDNESGFKIERKTGTGGTYTQIATVGASVASYSNTGRTASTTYYYRVRAYNAGGNSPYCDEAQATTLPPPPAAPVKKSPANRSTGASLTPRLEWNASTGASDYGLQVSTSSAFTSLLVNEAGITNLYYDIPGGLLKRSTSYYWRVNARNSFGTSAWSVYWSFRTATVPPPTNLVATAISSSRIDLSWQDNSDNESGFKIERKTGTGGTYTQIATVGANVASYSNTGLTASTTYYYRVRAYNATTNSPYCDEAQATTFPPPPPAPVLKSPANGSTRASLTPRLEWNASTGASDYALQVSTISTFTTLVVNEAGITNLYYDIPGGLLNWNTSYYWRVNARDSFGSTSAWSVYWSFKTATGPPPNAPSNLVATAISSSQVNLSWQDNSDNESRFRIERKTGSSGTYAQIATVGANVSSYSNTGRTANTTYYYRVRAYNAGGNSPYCDETSATTLPPPPPAPVKKSPASASTVSSLTPRLEWNASTGASDYALQVSTRSTFTTLVVNEAGITNLYYDIPGGLLNWNTSYYWRVNAHNSFGTSAWSSYWYFRTLTGVP